MFRLKPVYKDYIWGGTRLAAYGKHAPGARIAESWEFSTHPDGLVEIADGPFAGQTLLDYLTAHPEAAPGLDASQFPVLVKLIDAKQQLSVQVHPNDAYAKAHGGGSGKTELWHILEADPGAYLYLGLNCVVTREELRQHIADGTVETVLHKVYVRPGETYYIPAGTLHAIGAGVLLCEVQESSNLTYRVYDYGRKDDDGNLRPLHIEQALAVTSLIPADCTPPDGGESLRAEDGWELTTLTRCPYFTMRRIVLDTETLAWFQRPSSMYLILTDGEAVIRQGETRAELVKGEGMFVPAGEAIAVTGHTTALIVYPGA